MFLSNTFRAFRHRDYLIFWLGLFLGHNAALIQSTAQGWLILELTDSPFYLGMQGLCLGTARFLFSPIGGAVVDRTDRRWLFIVTQSAFLTMALFLTLMLYLGTIQVWHILAMSMLSGFFLAFEQPIRQSLLHDLVPPSDLTNAVSLYQLVFQGSVLFGPAVGGMLIPIIGVTGCFLFDAIGSFIILLSIFMIRFPAQTRPQEKKPLYRDVREGLSVAWNDPIFFSLFSLLAVMSFCAKPYTQFMPVFARDILQVGAPGLGLLLMAPGAGAIVGGLLFASMTRFPKPHRFMFVLAAGFGLAIISFAASPSFRLSLLLLFAAGGFQTCLHALITTMLQMHAGRLRGRMMALFGMINRGLGPMGAFPIGAIATFIGTPLTVGVGGAIAIVMAAYIAVGKSELKRVRMAGDNEGEKSSQAV
jgi:MFS family permease